MAASGYPNGQLLRELDAPSSSEEDVTVQETRVYSPMRVISASLALCGAAAIAAVVVLQPGAMGNMRASAQSVVSLAASSKYECPTCETNKNYGSDVYTCGSKAVTASGCDTTGCQSKSDASNFCIMPVNSKLINQPVVNAPSNYQYVCTTSPQNNPYECPAANGGCSLKTCEVGKSYDKTKSYCAQRNNLSDTTCGTDGCIFSPHIPNVSECYGPEYTNLISTMSSPGAYQYVCQYTGKKPSHPYMCPKPPAQASCVLGTSVMNTLMRGKTLVRDVQVGERVLADHGVYEPVIDFLHALSKPEGARLIHINHAMGRLSASAEHVLFVFDGPSQRLVSKAMEDVRVGDFLVDSEGQHRAVTDVVEGVSGYEGLFAPLTPSGTMIVDGMLMSNYAGVGGKRIPHGAMHAAFFLLRVWRCIVPASKLASQNQLNPMASLLWRVAGPLVLPASF